MSAVSLTYRGLDRWARDLKRSPKAVKRAIRKNLGDAGRFVKKRMAQQFGPRFTSRRTRKRVDRGSRLGTFTGRGKKSLRLKIRVKSARNFRAFIGPVGRASFYLAFHDRGESGFPKRELIEPTVRATKERVEQLIGKAVKAIR